MNNINICNNVINQGTNYSAYYGIVTPTGGTVTNINIKNNIIVGFDRYPVYVYDQIALSMDAVSIEKQYFLQ